jgi:hypothetical protein
MGQGGGAVGNIVDVEELSARDTFVDELGLSVALRRR